MRTTEPQTDLEHAPNHTPLLDHPEPPPAAVRNRLLIRVSSSITLVSLFFVSAFLLILLYQHDSTYTDDNSAPSESSSQQPSAADRLRWERTAFHFQPAKNFIYDPNGPLFHMGWYHLFYQYNPYAPFWGNMTWGHAVSKDMINWFELPIALAPTEWYDIEGVLSGSTTILPDGRIFALYTGNTNDLEQLQCKAVPVNASDPLLVEWVRYDANPILYAPSGIGLTDYRDPSTVWTGPDGKHRMIIGTKRNTTGLVLVYHTTDFTNYVMLDEPLHSVPNTDMWECVDLYPVSTTNDSALDVAAYGPGIKHVLKESWEGHAMDFYSIGTYDAFNDKWTPDNPELDVGIGLRCDYGRFFASKSLYDPLKKRRVTWGYVAESDSYDQDVSRGWATIYNVARTIVLDRKTGTHLLQWPVEEIESLRSNGHEFKNITLEPGSIIPLDVGSATQLDIVATFEVDQEALKATSDTNDEYGCTTSSGAAQRGSFGPFGIAVLAHGTLSELTPVYFYIAKNTKGGVDTHFCTDKLRSSYDYDGEKVVYGSTVPVLDGEEFTMRILVDHSVVEGFAQGGRTVITSRVYPTKAIYEAAKLFVFNNATTTSVKATLKVWQMSQAFVKAYPF
ncbi:beta-fructofuranosidase, soluble isoenzyme I-like [Cynara cardunculus var. scolymus]|uniref:Fructan fructan 1-fructosyltransferase n=1 Tax=Cynara cardunculus var. scolymus TaxID=59895 RepID=O65778_CYNCS|nr:beta-fructofuranosidase, soluble isoenzyme I-like [Cynara cardunculus var. scolymus]CAA04120.2 fructan fructan 1-fructosyltransferase [Cynara cardunculus var. scolymus]